MSLQIQDSSFRAKIAAQSMTNMSQGAEREYELAIILNYFTEIVTNALLFIDQLQKQHWLVLF